MNETTFGYPFDISWDDESKQTVLVIDAGDCILTLTREDLYTLVNTLEDAI